MDEGPNTPIAFAVLVRMHQSWPAEFNRIKNSLEQHCNNLARRKYGYADRGARGPETLMARFPLLIQYMPKPCYWILFPCLRYVLR